MTALQNNPDSGIDIRRYVNIILRNWYWIALGITLGLLLAFMKNRYTDPVYRVDASILIKEADAFSNPTSDLLFGEGLFPNDKKEILNQSTILTSFPLIKKTIENLNFEVSYFRIGNVRTVEIYDSLEIPFTVHFKYSIDDWFYNQPFEVKILDSKTFKLEAPVSDGEKSKIYHFGEPIIISDFQFRLIRNPIFPKEDYRKNTYRFVFNDVNDLAASYQNSLNVVPVDEEATILNVSVEGEVPLKDIDFLNKLLELYQQENLTEKNIILSNSIDFIEHELVLISDSLRYTEARLESFKSRKNVVDVSKEGEKIFNRLTTLETQNATYTIKAKYYDYLLDYLSKHQDFKNIVAPSSFGIDDPVLNKLTLDLVSLQLEKNNIIDQGGLKNPALKVINDRIENIRITLLENVRNLKSSNQIILQDYEERMSILQEAAKKLPRSEREFVDINRIYKLSESIYMFLMQKKAEAGIARSSNAPDSKIIEPAIIESTIPLSPKKTLNYAIGFILGLIIPTGLLFLIDYINNTVTDKNELESLSIIPLLGQIGHKITNDDLVFLKNPRSIIAESFRTIRSNLLFVNRQHNNQVYLITSSVSGEGKTFCSLNIASVLAVSGKKTILVSADLRKPNLSDELELKTQTGLSDYLINTAALKDIIQDTPLNNFDFIGPGTLPPNPGELLISDKVKELLTALKEQYDAIVLDTPPIGLVADALTLLPESDVNIFIVRQNYTRKEAIKYIDEMYRSDKIKNVGIILNDVKLEGYGYYGYGQYFSEENLTFKEKISGRISRLFKKR